ncbi:MAG: hypothetical protein GC180_01565 [Bacteroidetes bacterium]|nr:hypothetical protein [Bacteroidota bacterium]
MTTEQRREVELSIESAIIQEGDQDSIRLLKLVGKPIKFLSQAGKSGFGAVRKFASMMLFIILSNLALLIYITYSYFVYSSDLPAMAWVLLSFVLAGFFSIFAAYRGYQFLLLEMIHQLYGSLESIFRALSLKLAERASSILNKKDTSVPAGLYKLVNSKEIVQTYFQKVPRFLKWGLQILLSKVPMYTILRDLDAELSDGNTQTAADTFYEKSNTWIREQIFAQNSTRWMWIIYLINMLTLLLIWYYKISG